MIWERERFTLGVRFLLSIVFTSYMIDKLMGGYSLSEKGALSLRDTIPISEASRDTFRLESALLDVKRSFWCVVIFCESSESLSFRSSGPESMLTETDEVEAHKSALFMVVRAMLSSSSSARSDITSSLSYY